MGNLFVDLHNIAYFDMVLDLIELDDVEGKAVIIHELVDDCLMPTGHAGGRYGFCNLMAVDPEYLRTSTWV